MALACMVRAEVLYDIALNEKATWSPFGGIEVSYIDREGYTESGAGALNLTVQSARNEFLASVMGVQIAGDFSTDGGMRVMGAARVGWAHPFLDDSATTSSAFSSSPSVVFESNSPERDRDSLRLGLEVEVGGNRDRNWSLFARYTGDITANAVEHIVRAGVTWSF